MLKLVGRYQAWVFTSQVDESGDELGKTLTMSFYKTIIVWLFDLLLLVIQNYFKKQLNLLNVDTFKLKTALLESGGPHVVSSSINPRLKS